MYCGLDCLSVETMRMNCKTHGGILGCLAIVEAPPLLVLILGWRALPSLLNMVYILPLLLMDQVLELYSVPMILSLSLGEMVAAHGVLPRFAGIFGL